MLKKIFFFLFLFWIGTNTITSIFAPAINSFSSEEEDEKNDAYALSISYVNNGDGTGSIYGFPVGSPAHGDTLIVDLNNAPRK